MASHLIKQDVKPLLDQHYNTEWCKQASVYKDNGAPDADAPEDPKQKKCHLKAGKQGCEAQYSIVTVTLALGRQMLFEHAKAA